MPVPPRLGIVATHPIQYYAPLFRLLASRGHVNVRVFYGWTGHARSEARDPGFDRPIKWDIPLLDGYEYVFARNVSRSPGTHHFFGMRSPNIVRLIREWSPDAVLVYGWNYQSHLAALRTLHGEVPVLFRGDSTLIDERPGIRRRVRRIALTWVYRHIDLALYVGQNNRRYFLAHGVAPSRMAWAPHSVDNQRFIDPTGDIARKAKEWRARLGIGDDDSVTLFAGKLEDKKAPELLLQCMIRRNEPNEHLVLVGSGPFEPALRRMAQESRRIHFLGFQNQSAMPIVYHMADVFVLPSRGPGETWGLAVNEAMAAGRPVIVSDRVGCAPDLVKDDQTGFVFPSGSETQLQACLARLLDNRSFRTELGRNAAREIARWSLAAQAECIESGVEQTLLGQRQADS
jgi:glycosyltransferase involved in cell wall biosynthesis